MKKYVNTVMKDHSDLFAFVSDQTKCSCCH